MKGPITVHMMVRNEEVFIQQAIESVLPLAFEVLVFDTGSTDSTIEKVKGIGSKKIKIFEKGPQNSEDLIALRNEMIGMTRTQ